MARKIKTKLIMQLRDQGMSRREMAKTRNMSLTSVCDVFSIAAERRITFPEVNEMDEDDAYRLFYPGKHIIQSVFGELDWQHVHKEFARAGMTLKLLHGDFRDDHRQGRGREGNGGNRWAN